MNYPSVITESIEELLAREHSLRGKASAVRVQMLRLFKNRTVQSVRKAASLLGYSERQLLRWWACYKTGGLDALLEQHPRSGRPCRVTQEA